MTLPPQGHPQYELKRRIADCRERLRRSRTGQKLTGRDAHAQTHAAHDEAAADESDDAPTQRRRPPARRGFRR